MWDRGGKKEQKKEKIKRRKDSGRGEGEHNWEVKRRVRRRGEGGREFGEEEEWRIKGEEGKSEKVYNK
jgi:hypothetical protein